LPGTLWAQAVSGVAAAPPVRVGLIGPFTGPSADFGMPMQNGVRMAVDEINAARRLPGAGRIELVIKDDTAKTRSGPPSGPKNW
jgi:branched-chain amino acid transport system substrate-binding protein